jgi:Fur family ferric uptake transcriptional regulator
MEPTQPETQDAIDKIRLAAKQRQIRWTSQRQVIAEIFIDSGDHLSAEELHQRVRDVDPSVSAATVYRTINLLVDIGVAVKRNFHEASATFECTVGKRHHHHLINIETGEVIEFVSEELEELKRRIANDLGFDLVEHELELFGRPLPEGRRPDGNISGVTRGAQV